MQRLVWVFRRLLLLSLLLDTETVHFFLAKLRDSITLFLPIFGYWVAGAGGVCIAELFLSALYVGFHAILHTGDSSHGQGSPSCYGRNAYLTRSYQFEFRTAAAQVITHAISYRAFKLVSTATVLYVRQMLDEGHDVKLSRAVTGNAKCLSVPITHHTRNTQLLIHLRSDDVQASSLAYQRLMKKIFCVLRLTPPIR